MKMLSKSRKNVCFVTALLLTACTYVNAAQVGLDVSLGQPLLPAGKIQTTYLKVGLTGFEMTSREDRPAVNIALVIDRSGSMAGQKLQQAKDAAINAIDRLSDRDVVSVVAYDTNVQVLLPATKASDKDAIKNAIRQLEAGDSTALFAGVSKGAAEVRKFLDRNKVNRVILLSDGLANVGPSSPSELGALGESLKRDAISVSTIGLGLGYNEDLMAQLARRSDGNHAFVENERDLVRIFNYEFGDVLSVVAQEVMIRVQVAEGIRPVRVLGRDAEIAGQNVTCSLNQLYSKQEKYLMLEIEVPAGEMNASRPVAAVEVTYANMATKTTDALTSEIAVRFSSDTEAVAAAENKPVMIAAIKHVANEQNKMAFALRRQGRIDEAVKLLKGNIEFLQNSANNYDSEDLRELESMNQSQSEAIAQPAASPEFQRAAKEAVEEQQKVDLQRTW